MSGKLKVGYWSDPLCVWAFVAQSRLDRLLEERGGCLDIEHRLVPVFGSLPQRFRTGAWARQGPEGRAEATRQVAAEHGRPEVTGRVWVDDTPASSWPVSMAVKAVSRLEREGRAAPGSTGAYLAGLREAFFVRNLNICRREAWLEVARACGVEVARLEALVDEGTAMADLWEDYEEKERLRLQGSPTWVFDGGRALLYGNVSWGVLRATVEELLAGVRPGGTACGQEPT